MIGSPRILVQLLLALFTYLQGTKSQAGIGLTLNNVQYTNNSVVTITDIGTGSAALLCTTTNQPCCLSTDGSQWYFPNGSAVQRSESLPYYRTRTFLGSGTVRLNRNPEGTTTGIFHCDILDASGDLQSLYMGIYTATTGSPNVTSLTFNSLTNTFTCTSTGGPATNVTWRKDGTALAVDGTYRQTQTVINATTATYQNVLTIAESVSSIYGVYRCTVGNARGTSSALEVRVFALHVSVSLGQNPTLGQPYTLTCNVSVASGVTGTPTVQWVGPGSSAPIVTGGDFTVSSTSPYTLTINPLRQSHAGQYTCQARVQNATNTTTVSLVVDVPGPPRNFTISVISFQTLGFSWNPPSVTNGVVLGYVVACRSTISGIPLPAFPLVVNVTEMEASQPQNGSLTGFSPGVPYNCSISALNAAGDGLPAYAVVTTTEIPPTGSPEEVTVTQRRARNITFSWSPPALTERNGVITGYSLSCVPETGGRNTISMQYTAAGTFTLGGFTPATSYNCSISASNSQGRGPAAYLINTTLEAPPDGPPQNFMLSLITNVPEMVNFFWEPPPLDQRNGIITGYNIVCTPSGQPVNFVVTDNVTSGTLNATVGIFTPATQYSCTITASTSAGPGPAETRDLITLPASPENVTLTTTSSPLRVTWTIDPPDGLVSNYTIYVTRLERGNTVVNYTSTNTQLLQFDVPNLDPYELVEVSVSASNSAGEGPRSPGVRERTREESPGIVSNCPSRWTDLASAIQVTWTAPERPNGVLLRYHIQLTSYDGRRVIASESVGSSTLLDDLDNSELQAGVPYIVSIFAENSAGNGTKCNVTDFTDELAPPAPSNVMVAYVSDNTIRASWQPLSLVEARGHITYRVMVTPTTGSRRRRQATQGERVCTLSSPCEVPANESSVIVGGLDRDTSFSVTVMAVNSEDEAGPTTVPITATAPTVPPTQTCVNIGTMVGVVVALVVVIIIMGVVIGGLVARNRRYKLSLQRHAVKDLPVKWSEVTGSGDTNIITTQCEPYVTVNQGHEYEMPEYTGQQPPGPEYEIPVTKCPAYVPTSEQEGGRVEEAVYEPV